MKPAAEWVERVEDAVQCFYGESLIEVIEAIQQDARQQGVRDAIQNPELEFNALSPLGIPKGAYLTDMNGERIPDDYRIQPGDEFVVQW